jgi:hypothetical protein
MSAESHGRSSSRTYDGSKSNGTMLVEHAQEGYEEADKADFAISRAAAMSYGTPCVSY